ncbi:MAG TPA: ATP-dependent DNA ligase [Solirubrobacteraceae bacterium]|jgi:ATP-dependent DNA ligase|nr:ATP-dependent DNA ligase [Solirubrobacteraceae bacterium]
MPPLSPPIAPQLARPRAALPDDAGWAYEPKWDGFRAIAFVDGDQVRLQSRNGRPLERYFPELRFPPGSYVLDGEIVIPRDGGGQEFNLLQQRIHPAASRIERLARETPAVFMAFDVLARDGVELLERPFDERRAALEQLLADLGVPAKPSARGAGILRLTPCVRERQAAEHWLHDAEGVIAKRLDAPYRPGERTGMVKVKRVRTIDCVVVGWRPGKEPDTVGALILGLYDDDGQLHVIGHSSGFTAARKRELVDELRPYETGQRGSGEASRWTQGRELEWIELRPELVVEVSFDHASDGRIRHGAKVLRFREDKPPSECRLDQLQS